MDQCSRHAYMDPGPEDPSVLQSQRHHRSQAVWYGQVSHSILRCRQHTSADLFSEIPECIIPYIRDAGFLGITRLGYIQLDHHLITALVERWRPETHTFHFPDGEMTITLQDIAIITGLQIDGDPVVGDVAQDWKALCRDLLGVQPPDSALEGGKVKLSWIVSQFGQVPSDADDEVVQQYARAYILRFIGGLLFTDKSGNKVHLMFLSLLRDLKRAGQYSWGSACLAHLYRELCRATTPQNSDVAGALLVVQVWAWEHIRIIAPKRKTHWETGKPRTSPLGCRWRGAEVSHEEIPMFLVSYRDTFDNLKPYHITWTPYTPDIIERLPEYCLSGRGTWHSVVPLICYATIEWHQPDRCMRQFGYHQPIPTQPYQEDKLHFIDLRSKVHDWASKHSDFIELWNNRHNRLISGTTASNDGVPYHSVYMEWYLRITRRWMTPTGALIGVMADGSERIYRNLNKDAPSAEDITDAKDTSYRMLGALQERRRLVQCDDQEHLPTAPSFQRPPLTTVTRKRRQGLTDNCQPIQLDLIERQEPVKRMRGQQTSTTSADTATEQSNAPPATQLSAPPATQIHMEYFS